MKKAIKELVRNDKKLKILEVGVGMPVSNALLQVNGASKTVISAICPYASETQGVVGIRSVSIEGVRAMMRTHGLVMQANHYRLAISAQAGPDKSAHGYICVNTTYIHFTLDYGTSKEKAADKIIGIAYYCIMRYMFGMHHDNWYSHFIDGVFTDGGHKFNPELLPEDHAPFIMRNMIWSRLAEKFRTTGRGYDKILIVKGSFNPFHDGHKFLITKDVLPADGYSSYFSMTSKTVEGKATPVSELIKRSFNTKSYCIIDSNCKTFKDLLYAIERICGKHAGRVYRLPMGADVLDKIDVKELAPYNVILSVYPRKITIQDIKGVQVVHNKANEYSDLSSTDIRYKEMKKKMF